MLICVTHMAVMGAVSAMAEDSGVAAFRVQTVRAFYATDSCVMICRRMLSSGAYLPAEGEELSLEHATATYVDVPPADADGQLVIEGRSGQAIRRVKVLLTR